MDGGLRNSLLDHVAMSSSLPAWLPEQGYTLREGQRVTETPVHRDPQPAPSLWAASQTLSVIRQQEKPLTPVDKRDQQAEGPEDAGAAPRGAKQTSRAVTHPQR